MPMKSYLGKRWGGRLEPPLVSEGLGREEGTKYIYIFSVTKCIEGSEVTSTTHLVQPFIMAQISSQRHSLT